MSVENSVRGLEFVDAKPVYFPPREQRWASDFGTSAAFLTAAIHDLDGSASGVPDSYIVIDNGIANDDDSCEVSRHGARLCARATMAASALAAVSPSRAALSRIQSRSAVTAGPSITAAKPRFAGGAELTVDTARESLPLRLSAMDADSSVVLKLPGFAAADAGVKQSSLAALREAGETSYYRDGDTLWVKLFPANDGAGGLNAPPSVTVSREGLGG
jgi:cell migration-inducing and hyaluronan-binding protein